jgi:hypothetical protein
MATLSSKINSKKSLNLETLDGETYLAKLAQHLDLIVDSNQNMSYSEFKRRLKESK